MLVIARLVHHVRAGIPVLCVGGLYPVDLRTVWQMAVLNPASIALPLLNRITLLSRASVSCYIGMLSTLPDTDHSNLVVDNNALHPRLPTTRESSIRLTPPCYAPRIIDI